MGFTIKDASTGISIGSDEEVTIRDCYITDTNYPIEAYADNDINLFNITLGLNGLQAVKMNGETIGYSNSSITRTWNINNLTVNPEGDLNVRSTNNTGTATLKVVGNAELAFNEGKNIIVGGADYNKRGALSATGVTFTALDTSLGWDGIYFSDYSDDGSSLIDSCIIEYADDGIYCASASPTITNSTIRSNTDGIYADSGSQPTITGNTFTGNERPVFIYVDRIQSNIYGNTYSGNTKDYIEVQNATLDENLTYVWSMDGAPYLISSDLEVRRDNNSSQLSTLKIDSGATVMFKNGVDLYIGHGSNSNYRGALIANGVTFTAFDSTGWNGIRFRNYADDGSCLIDSSIIEGADDGIRALPVTWIFDHT